jgi:hypothetical protein
MPLSYLRSRARLLLGLGVVVAAARLIAIPGAPPRTVEGVAMLLGRAVHGHVAPEDFVWEAHSELFVDELWGRRVLFLARRGDNREVYRARVRLTRRGRPIAVAGATELSGTPKDDDSGLIARGPLAASAMVTAEGVLGVRVLDLRGEGAAREAKTLLTRLLAGLQSYRATGSFRGVRVLEVAFARPPSQVKLEFAGDKLVLALGDEHEPASVDIATAAVNPGPTNPYGMRAQELRLGDASPARVLPELAEEVFGARLGELARAAARALVRPRAFATAEPPDGPPLAVGADGWPPPALASVGARGPGDDGSFHALVGSSLEGAPAAAALAAATPAGGSRAWVRVVALDARQLELVLVPGQAAPAVEAGPHGFGELPGGDDLVALFNGVSPSMGMDAGMTVDGRIFAQPVLGRPTFIPSAPEGPRLIAWDGSASLRGSLRQSGVEAGDQELAERSSLCVTGSGHLAYAYGVRARPSDLSAALAPLGCRGTMPLASSPGPVGFARPRAASAGGGLEPIDPMMSFPPPLPERGSRDDFFAVVRRSSRLSPELDEGSWLIDRGVQPAPAWLAAVHEATLVKLGVQVRVLRLAPMRFLFRLRAGTREIVARGAPSLPTRLEGDDVGAASVAVALGIGRRRGPSGLTIDGSVGLQLRGGGTLARLVADPRQRALHLLGPADAEAPPGADVTELPLLVEARELLAHARELGQRVARGALCVVEDGTVLIATTTFDSHEAAARALLDLGCSRVAALDRGAYASALVERAMPDRTLPAEHESTTLYAVGAPMGGVARPSFAGSGGAVQEQP